MIPPQPEWDESRRPSAFCRECECETNHTTKEHREAVAQQEQAALDDDIMRSFEEEGGES